MPLEDGMLSPEICSEIEQQQQEVARSIEHIIFPTAGRRLIATQSLLSGVVEIANLPGLYRIFERC